MAGKRDRGSGSSGGGARTRSQLAIDKSADNFEDQEGEKEGEQNEEKQQFDHHNDQLMAMSDEEDNDDGEDERHYLIGGQVDEGSHSSQHLNRAKQLESLRASSSSSTTNGKHSPALLGAHMERRNLIKRLAGYLGSPFRDAHRQQQRQEANLDDISTSDFAYQPKNFAPPADIRLPAYYYNYDSPPSTKTNNHRSHTRPLLLIMLFLLLILSTLMLLVKLLSLVQDEQSRLGAPGDGSSPLHNNMGGSIRQDTVISELSRRLDVAHQRQLEAERLSRWLVSSSKCHIPVLDPWHESIREYVHKKAPLNCSRIIQDEWSRMDSEEDTTGVQPRKKRKNNKNKNDKRKRARAGQRQQQHARVLTETLSYVHENRLYFTERALEIGVLRRAPVGQPPVCCYRSLARKIENDNELEAGEACTPIEGQGVFPNSSIVEINCAGLNYTNVHSFIVHNQEEELALKRVAGEKLDELNHYSVLMVGMDTISRLNGQRQLNATLTLLRNLYGTLEFAGYNKVGENTFPNLIPLLTGLKPSQLTEVQCWLAKGYTDESERADEYLDNCKYLWNYYQQVGYMTYFSEDWPAASTMNYLKPGFKNEPTTFYGRPFTLARDKLLWPKFKSIGCSACQLDRPIVEVDLENLRSFIKRNDNQLPYFAFHWINCPHHDDLNGASQVDAIMERFFADLHKRLQDDRTFVIFFSDHGYRWNDFVSTRIGHYESSLPMLTIAPPRHFVEHQPEMYKHLKAHQNALLTPFDLFKTFIHLRDLSSKSTAHLRREKKVDKHTRRQAEQSVGSTLTLLNTSISAGAPSGLPRATNTSEVPPPIAAAAVATATATTIEELILDDGTTYRQKFNTLSLFDAHSRDQLDRSCIEAGIPDNYCVCQQFAPVPTNRTDVLGATYYLVYGHFEALIREHSQLCHALDLEQVQHAEIYNFDQEAKLPTSGRRRRRRRQVVISGAKITSNNNKQQLKTTTHVPDDDHDNDTDDLAQKGSSSRALKHTNYLPNREYSIMFSTRPGSGLFQEVVRYYGDNMARCEQEIEHVRKVVEDPWAELEDKRKSVASMNSVCKYSVHSESLSRLNLYKEQSKCITSNIELKKVCYCNDLIH